MIPIGARITAVTDTYDALTWSRAHGEAVAPRRAAAELVRCAGVQFDPEVVHAWLRVLDGERAPRVEPSVSAYSEELLNAIS
jgi:HD-GYP domain-containing protein (c-di-GMP phosphodiesterase class II)